MNSSEPPTRVLRLSQSADLPAAIAYGLGYHPSPGSLAHLAIAGRRLDNVGCLDAGRVPADAFGTAIDRVAKLAGDHGWRICLVAYGDADEVLARATAMLDALAARSVPVLIAVRLDHDRLDCLQCDDCSLQGVPVDLAASAVAADFVYAGRVAAPDRGTLDRRLQPVAPHQQQAMAAALGRATERLAALAVDAGEAVVAEGIVAVDQAGRTAPAPLDDDGAAWLLLLLRHQDVRDHAWRTATLAPDHVPLWADLVRRVPAALRVAPACLLAAAALAHGDGILANGAVDLAMAEDPAYSMAGLLRQVLIAGVSPDQYRALMRQITD
jgi:hypothetical protein